MRAQLLLVLVALAACARTKAPPPAPAAEFIIAAADSVFWVRSDTDGIRVRGAPMVLAQVGGRFAELYVADEDYSFYDAAFIGQRLFKRDLISGDVAAFRRSSRGGPPRIHHGFLPRHRQSFCPCTVRGSLQ